MMERVQIPVREYKGEKWGSLAFIQPNHEIVGYDFRCIEQYYSFCGQHRVRLYKVSGNVHFRIPSGAEFNISDVAIAAPARRQEQRHNKRR